MTGLELAVYIHICILMAMVDFDPAKRILNLKNHGIDLVDAEPVLYDPFGLTVAQVDEGELRQFTVGIDALGRVLAVAWTERSNGARLISARKATGKEMKAYEKRT
jgi:uncharacterized DUF497 family protein